jgi:hypothetical protein
MFKSYKTLISDIKEWSTGTNVTDVISVKTGKAKTAKRPSIRQLKNNSPSRKEIAALNTANWGSGGIT